MEQKNILTVIEELGSLIEKYKSDIQLKEWDIERLNKKIKQIEDFANFYSEDTVTKEDYKEVIKWGISMKLVFRKLHLIVKHIWFYSPRAENTLFKMKLYFLNKGDPIVI